MWNGCSNEKNDKDTILKIILLLALLLKKLKVLKNFLYFSNFHFHDLIGSSKQLP